MGLPFIGVLEISTHFEIFRIYFVCCIMRLRIYFILVALLCLF
jgi:hypothetical protein